MKDKSVNVLLIEDNPGDARLIQAMLAEAAGSQFEVECVSRLSTGLERLIGGGADLLLLDLTLPDSCGINTFVTAHKHAPEVPIVLLMGHDDDALAIEMVHAGAQDCLVKGRVDTNLLTRSLRYAIERKRAGDELRMREQQQAAVAELGQQALADAEPATLFDHAVALVTQTLAVEYASVLDLLPHGKALRLRAGVGWKAGTVGRAIVGADRASQAGYTLHSRQPVIVEDLRTETRFSSSPLLHEQAVVSGISVVIACRERALGVLSAHTTRRRRFTQDDIHFLQAIAHILAMAEDRKQAEAALREREARLQLLIEQMPAILWSTDAELRFTSTLGAGLAALNLRAGDLVGSTLAEYFGTEDPEFAPISAHRRALGGKAVTYELEWQGRAFESHAEPLRNADGAITGIIGAALDITERKRAEQVLQRYAAEMEQRVAERTAALQETNAELESFCYSVSHDLRAPLRAMQGFGEALLEDHADQLGATGQEYAARIAAAASQMDALIQDLLAYSRLTRAELELRPIGLDAVIAEVLDQLETELRDRHVQVAVKKPLPVVVGHHATLVQVVTNLLTNAAKFVAPGVRPEVRVWGEEHEGRARLCVADNGIGISPEHRERIFRVFERLHGVETYPGTGIGLAIVRKGVERMEGRVGVASEPGQGSRFWVDLPVGGSEN